MVDVISSRIKYMTVSLFSKLWKWVPCISGNIADCDGWTYPVGLLKLTPLAEAWPELNELARLTSRARQVTSGHANRRAQHGAPSAGTLYLDKYLLGLPSQKLS